jgi:alkylation response protein AidB-like acyl-CoA dehydrogenase
MQSPSLSRGASQEDLDALGRSISAVLGRTCTSRAVHDHVEGRGVLGTDLWDQARDLGWLGVPVPADHGGLEMGAYGLDLLYREMGRVTAPGGILSTLIALAWLAEVGSPSLQGEIFPLALEGAAQFALPMSDDVAAISIGPDGAANGVAAGYLGESGANFAIAPVSGAAGCFAVIRLDGKRAFLRQRPSWDLTRLAGDLVCDGGEVLDVFGDQGGRAISAYHKSLCLAVAADSIGGAREIIMRTVEYMKGRSQFGQLIASFQALKHRIADAMLAIVEAENLCAYALQLADSASDDAEFWLRLAKSEAARTYKYVSEESVLLHGGVGFTEEFDSHIYLKRARLNEVLGGRMSKHLDYAADHMRKASRANRSIAEIAW